MLAVDAWRMLKNKVHQEGLFIKLNGMHKALHTKFSFDTLTLDTLTKFKNLIAAYSRGAEPLLTKSGPSS